MGPTEKARPCTITIVITGFIYTFINLMYRYLTFNNTKRLELINN